MNKIDTLQKSDPDIFLKLKMIGKLFGKELEENSVRVLLENLLDNQFSLLEEDFNIFFPGNKPLKESSLSLAIKLVMQVLKKEGSALNVKRFEQFIDIIKKCFDTENGEADLLKNGGFLLEYYDVFCSREYKQVEHSCPAWLEEDYIKESMKNKFRELRSTH
jgi:hypothetical protein